MEAVALSEKLGLIEESPVLGVIVATLDGLITEANDAFLRIVDYSREDLVAGKITRCLLTPPECIIGDDAGVAWLSRSEAVRLEHKDYIRKDGARVRVLVHGQRLDEHSALVIVILDPSEHRCGDQELQEAMSSKRELGEALEQSQSQLRQS